MTDVEMLRNTTTKSPNSLHQSVYNLFNAVIVQACDDYRIARRRQIIGQPTAEDNRMVAECLRFFESNFFQSLTDISACYLVGRLEKELEEEDRNADNRKHGVRRNGEWDK